VTHPLKSLRDYYLDCFRKSIVTAPNHFDQFTTELLLELASPKHYDYCYRLYRADIISKHRGKTAVREVNVSVSDVASWETVLPARSSIDAPLAWNGIEFRVDGASTPEADLVVWATVWIDATDSRYDEATEFQYVVHNITPPAPTASGFTLSVDFGSAPIVAFDELLQLLVRDADRVSVGSFQLCSNDG
jgi:hypothetical protein